MKKNGFAAAFAVIILAMFSPAQAEIIADQSRISVGSPKAPYFDKMIWHEKPNAYVNY